MKSIALTNQLLLSENKKFEDKLFIVTNAWLISTNLEKA